MTRVFSKYDNASFPFRFDAELELPTLVGGVPSDPKVAEGWLRSKLQETDDRIREMVANVMAEREVDPETALTIVNEMKNLNGFKRSPAGVLFIEGRQVKAAMKEAVSCAASAGKINMTGWGATRKWIKGFFPEHVFVVEETVEIKQRDPHSGELVGVKNPTSVNQQFVHTHRGSSIQYQEYVRDAVVQFTVISDWPFTTKDWAMLWTSGEKQGLGASRSQGYGAYSVTKWSQQEIPEAVKKVMAAAAEAKKAK